MHFFSLHLTYSTTRIDKFYSNKLLKKWIQFEPATKLYKELDFLSYVWKDVLNSNI